MVNGVAALGPTGALYGISDVFISGLNVHPCMHEAHFVAPYIPIAIPIYYKIY